MLFNSLKSDVLEQVKKANPLFSAAEGLKQSHFLVMADIINDALANSPEMKGENVYRLGNTISAMTLRRFFQNRYTPDTVSDMRFLKSIDKLAIFLGFKDFNHYCASRPEGKPTPGQLKEEDGFKQIIRDYCAAEFRTFAQLPQADVRLVAPYLFAECPLRARIDALMHRFAKLGLRLVQENSRSGYEVYDICIISQTEDAVACETKEFWNMLFRSDSGEEYSYHKKNEQIYFLKKDGAHWKLWDNYNPDSGSLMKQTEIFAV